jgi:hypothetical protein
MTHLPLAPVISSSRRVTSLAGRAELLGALAGLAPLPLGSLLDVPQVAELGRPQADPGFGRLFQSLCLELTGKQF